MHSLTVAATWTTGAPDRALAFADVWHGVTAETKETLVATEFAPIMAWTLRNEIAIPDDVQPLLVEGEQAVAAFATFRDSAIFTTRRLIVRDAQGFRGKKVEIYSLPYKSINMWSSENAGGVLDRDGELELWTRVGHIKVRLLKGLDVRRLDQLIAWAVLHAG